MHQADQLLAEGDLSGARAALIDHVRREPGDVTARMFLFQLQAIGGEWDKALKALELLAQLSPEAQMLAVAYGQATAAERQREAVFAGTAEAHLFGETGWATPIAQSLHLFAAGDREGGKQARDAAFDAAPDTPGRFGEAAFDWIADADPRFGPVLEVIIAGRYGLLPFAAVSSIKSEGPRDLRDLVWYPVEIAMRSGQSVAGFIPTRYPATVARGDSAELLARATSWHGDDAAVAAGGAPGGWASGGWGSGQRLLALSDGSEVGLLELTSLTFN